VSVPLAVPPAASAEEGPLRRLRVLGARVGAMCLVELQKLRRDQTELLTRAIQPAWAGNVENRRTLASRTLCLDGKL